VKVLASVGDDRAGMKVSCLLRRGRRAASARSHGGAMRPDPAIRLFGCQVCPQYRQSESGLLRHYTIA
jgi:hypothetical protein